MPNEVFLRTRAGLSTMVSSRAAARILEGALKGSGNNPDDVSGSQMRTALMGPVLQELESVLPRDGLKRNLERLAKSLRDSPNGDQEIARALLTGSIPADVEPITELDMSGDPTSEDDRAGEPAKHDGVAIENSPYLAAPAAEPAFETVAQESPAGRAPEGPFDAFAGPPTVTKNVRPAAPNGEPRRVTPRLLRRQGDEELEEKVTRFALIEHVQLVAAVRADGSIPVVRGEGLDLDLLSRMSRLTLSLLARGGDLRSLHLGHTLGQLFLFPMGPDLLVVYGGADLNLGSVTTAFTALALEEEL